jgi:hypothetical protein
VHERERLPANHRPVQRSEVYRRLVRLCHRLRRRFRNHRRGYRRRRLVWNHTVLTDPMRWDRLRSRGVLSGRYGPRVFAWRVAMSAILHQKEHAVLARGRHRICRAARELQIRRRLFRCQALHGLLSRRSDRDPCLRILPLPGFRDELRRRSTVRLLLRQCVCRGRWIGSGEYDDRGRLCRGCLPNDAALM